MSDGLRNISSARSTRRPSRRRAAFRLAFLVAAVVASTIAATVFQTGSSVDHRPDVRRPVVPYISPRHIDELDGGRLSFYMQPWRGYLETHSASSFLDGIGVVYNDLPAGADHDGIMKSLASAGFRSFRLEVGWDSIAWTDESNGATIRPDRRSEIIAILRAAKRHGLRPLILLNANHGAPTPHRRSLRTAVRRAPKGAHAAVLASTAGLRAGYSGISNQSLDGWMADVLITDIDGETIAFDKPLPRALEEGDQVPVDTLRYAPLHPVGTRRFEETADGWLRYAAAVIELVHSAGFDQFSVEMWNELTFGSNFLWIGNYRSADTWAEGPAGLRPGGPAYELARRTVAMTEQKYPRTSVIWGYSNTTFHHTPIEQLPAGTDGQSYHPYGTAKRDIPDDFPSPEKMSKFGFVPANLTWSMPEGWAHLGVKEEQLPGTKLRPDVRHQRQPPGVSDFSHYITEHGFSPAENGITSRDAAHAYKAKALIRALTFWLNKGISRMYIYNVWASDDTGMGLLFADRPDPDEYGGGQAEATMSPSLRALRNVTETLSDAIPLRDVRQLSFAVSRIGADRQVFAGDATHPPLYYREMLALLPMQVTATQFAIPVYVMSYDITQPLEQMEFEITVNGIDGRDASLQIRDPITDDEHVLEPLGRSDTAVTVRVPVTDYPRLLMIDEDS